MSAVATAIVVGGYIASEGQKESAAKSAELQGSAADQAIQLRQREQEIARGDIEPFRLAGVKALTEQQALLGLSGQPAQQEAFQRFESSPGQEFLRGRGEQTLLRNQAAIGGLGGGQVRSELQQQGIGFAQQDLQNKLAQLASIAGQGQVAASNVAQLGGQAASGIGGLITQGAQAQAGGVLGAQQGRTQFASSVGTGLGFAAANRQPPPPATTQPAAQQTTTQPATTQQPVSNTQIARL